MPIIRATQTCFDDALDYLAHHPGVTLAHGLCRLPDGQPFAHAWVEDGDLVREAGLLDGRRLWLHCARATFYAEMGVQNVTRYTMAEATCEIARTHANGPWKPAYVALCGEWYDAPA